MDGGSNLDEYKLVYSIQFRKSLREIVDYWRYSLHLSDEKINIFLQLIYSSTQMLKDFPFINEDVASVYGFNEPTYRILIGDRYALFYRVNEEDKIILVGNIFGQNQMKVRF